MKHTRKRIRFKFPNENNFNAALDLLNSFNVPYYCIMEKHIISVTNKRYNKYDLDLRLFGLYSNTAGTFNGLI